ncbi:MAG: peptidoglycan bridge formation glycyltransferase FemA/FemB family protein [Patescibacteria group bacterium]|jgi:lipid II:glycine glycyltransferase (peptidoglycan interpeptide bridge formation enzyme)|nr:peptidoglycan bridge formation glycyltransferase FemA/FemB family protein [Patescibacteria group bacterium]
MNNDLNNLKVLKVLHNEELSISCDSFVIKNSDLGGELLSSSIWSRVLDLDNSSYERLCVKNEKGDILLCGIFEYQKILFWQYAYSPRGPIFNNSLDDKEKVVVFDFFVNELKKKNKDLVFYRFEPFFGFRNLYNLNSKKNVLNVKDIQPQKTLCLDLRKSEDELLSSMHQKTRYNIRLAKRKGVEVFEVKDKEIYFNYFWRLMQKTGIRDSFGIHSRSHYLNILMADDNFKLYLAKYDDNIIAAGIFSNFGKRVTYLHGASDNSFRKLMAPHFLQFKVIQEAKKDGFLYYDFYGIDEKKWPGVTRFKKGFSGFEFEYGGTCEYVFSKTYYKLYQLLKKFKSLIK